MPAPKSAPPAPWPAGARAPAVAGTFYPADPAECRAAAAGYIDTAAIVAGAVGRALVGGIVPHAGWVCSAAIAGQTLAHLARSRAARGLAPPDVVVVFAAVHSATPLDVAALSAHASWALPGGACPIDQELSLALEASPTALFRVDERFHAHEHAVEVEVPLIQATWPGARVLPVEVPAVGGAARAGEETVRLVREMGRAPVYLASSDLTHYGPAYGFAPAGVGPAALAWALENDRPLLDLACAMRAELVVAEAAERLNACGAGAIAAMLAACRAEGATAGQVLTHANSYQTLAKIHPQPPVNAVGYASVVIG